jgi:hypothetical protein
MSGQTLNREPSEYKRLVCLLTLPVPTHRQDPHPCSSLRPLADLPPSSGGDPIKCLKNLDLKVFFVKAPNTQNFQSLGSNVQLTLVKLQGKAKV